MTHPKPKLPLFYPDAEGDEAMWWCPIENRLVNPGHDCETSHRWPRRSSRIVLAAAAAGVALSLGFLAGLAASDEQVDVFILPPDTTTTVVP